MGIDLENFDYNVSQEFLCPSCRKVLHFPLVTSCSHILCTRCFNKRSKKRLKCPVCGSPMGDGKKQLEKSWVKRYEQLGMNCTKGCEMAVTVGELQNHLSNKCPLTFTLCTNVGCPKKVRRRDLTQHFSVCDYRVVKCENCGYQTQFPNLRTHQLIKKCGMKRNLHMIVQKRREMNALVKEHKRVVDQETFQRTLNEREMEKSKLWSTIYRNNPNRPVSRSPSPARMEEERASTSLSRLSTYSGRLRSSRSSAVASPDSCTVLCMNCKKLFLEETNHDHSCQWHEGVCPNTCPTSNNDIEKISYDCEKLMTRTGCTRPCPCLCCETFKILCCDQCIHDVPRHNYTVLAFHSHMKSVLYISNRALHTQRNLCM